MKTLCNGATYSNPYLSEKNAEFLIYNGFTCIPITENRIGFYKKNLEMYIHNNEVTVFMKVLNQTVRTVHHVGIDLQLRDFASLMFNLYVINAPEKVEGCSLILEVTNFNLDCEPSQN